jgi:hypothetical protein
VGSASDYLRRIGSLYRSMWEDQLALMKDVTQLSPSALSEPKQITDIMGRAASTWGGWFSRLREFAAPGPGATAAPILAFVVDASAEVSAVQRVPVPDGAARDLSASDLFPLGGQQRKVVSSRHISCQLVGNELQVGLVNLGHGRRPRGARGITPGLYAAVIASKSAGSSPLALLHVTFLE